MGSEFILPSNPNSYLFISTHTLLLPFVALSSTSIPYFPFTMVKTSPASSARLLLPLLLCCFLLSVKICVATGTADGSEQWGYVEVRPSNLPFRVWLTPSTEFYPFTWWICYCRANAEAHLFWWRYRSPQRIENGSTPWPTVLWLQGGPVSRL